MLKSGKAIERPIYDFKTHTRVEKTVRIEPAEVIIVEGILLFADPSIRELMDLKLYVETDDDIRVLRRIERDIQERGRDLEGVHHQYVTTVKPMHKQFVEPSKQYADVIIPGGSDTTAALTLILEGLRTRK
jgi:uridine kinase